jgi:hypothetical protein
VFLAFRQVVLGIDGFGWALRFAQRAIDTFFRVNGQKIRTFMEAVHRADFYTIHVFTLDAIFCNNEGHCACFPLFAGQRPGVNRISPIMAG